VTEGIRRCEEALESVRGNRRAEAIVLAALAPLKAMDEAFDEARSIYGRVQTILVELDARLDASSTSIEASRVEILAGDLEAAEALLRRDDAALAELDERYFRSTITAILANVLALRGAFAEAERYAALAAELADDDDLWSQVAWRTARAKVLAGLGDGDGALALADEAVALSIDGEDIELRADALTEQGRVRIAVGHRESSGPPLREALELYGAKGDRAAARLVMELLSDPMPA
jgi:ATP/maltotriose-dependent transcriptional regulator MalT